MAIEFIIIDIMGLFWLGIWKKYKYIWKRNWWLYMNKDEFVLIVFRFLCFDNFFYKRFILYFSYFKS